MDQADWNRLLDTVSEIHGLFPEGVAFIGGIAVYAHMMDADGGARLAAMSHDGDLMIRIVDFSDLRDVEMVTPNRRLGKHQFLKNGFEFDVYVENQHDLAVPVDEAIAWSEIKHGIRVACLEHLLILKMKAYEDRAGSPKGVKDEDDIARILFAGLEWRKECLGRMTDEMISTCERIVAGDAPVRLMGGNLHHAKALRGRVRASLEALKAAFSQDCSEPPCSIFARLLGASMMHPEILDLAPVPPPAYGTVPAGRQVAFEDIVRSAGMWNVVTLPFPPDIRLHDGFEDFLVPRAGRPIYCVSAVRLPFERRARSREVLRRLAYGFFDYAAREVVARHHRDLKRSTISPDLDGADRSARRAMSEAALRVKRALRSAGSASIGELAEMTGMAQPNVSRIVGIMVENETVQLERDGRRTICRLKVIPLDELPAPSMR